MENVMQSAIEIHLKELGFFPATLTETLEELRDLRHVYLAKGYYSDPRDENAEVPF